MMLIGAPILIGCLLTDECHFILTELIIIHSLNRYISEPHVFGLAVFIARFLLYYDFEMTLNIPLNFLIGLLISKKFFSILPLIFVRYKMKIYYSSFISIFNDISSLAKLCFTYMKMILTPMFFNFFLVYIYSLITGASINFLKLNYYFPFPSPPKPNIFWDFQKETIHINDKIVETIVYLSHLESFRENLYMMIKSGQLGIVDEDSFFLFILDNYIIICHVISINAFSIKFQLRCAEFMTRTLCHRGELSFLNTVSDIDYLRQINTDDMPIFLRSDYSPVAKNVELSGYHEYLIDVHSAFISLTPELKISWMTYATLYVFSKHKDEFVLPSIFNNPVPDINSDQNDIENDILDDNAFDQFEFGDSIQRVYNFLNVICREIYRCRDSLHLFFNDLNSIHFTNKFPLFHNQENDNDNRNINGDQITGSNINENRNTNENNNENNNNGINHGEDESISSYSYGYDSDYYSDYNTVNIEYSNASDIDESEHRFNNDDIGNSNENNNENVVTEEENNDLKEEKVKWLIKESAKKVCLYWYLASSYLTPEFNNKHEVREFIEQIENEYIIVDSDYSELEPIIISYREKNKKESLDHKNIMTYGRKNGISYFAFINYVTANNWTVFKLNREFVKSIWTCQCQDVIGNNNTNSERNAKQENNDFLHNLIIQISDIPIEYPAYVSDIDESIFIWKNI